MHVTLVVKWPRYRLHDLVVEDSRIRHDEACNALAVLVRGCLVYTIERGSSSKHFNGLHAPPLPAPLQTNPPLIVSDLPLLDPQPQLADPRML